MKQRLMGTMRLAVAATLLAYASFIAHPATATEPPYEINVILSLTGSGAFIGAAIQHSLSAFESLTNAGGGIKGRPIHFSLYDDQTNAQVAVQLANSIIAKHPAIFMGPSLSATCRATAPLAQGGPVQYCLSPAYVPDKGSNVFAAGASGYDNIVLAIRYLRGMGYKKIAKLTTTDTSGQEADDHVSEVLALSENKDMQLVASEHFNGPDVTVSAQIAKIKQAAPQALLIWAPGTPFATALRGMSDAGLSIPVATTNANMINAQMKQYASFLPSSVVSEGTAYVAGIERDERARPAAHAFSEAMRAGGIAPDFVAGVPWDPAAIVVDTLRHLGTNATAEQIHAYILNLHNFPGASGMYDFRKGNRGLDVNDILVMQWDANKGNWSAVSRFGGLPLKQ